MSKQMKNLADGEYEIGADARTARSKKGLSQQEKKVVTEAALAPPEPAEPAVLAVHTVQAGDTLSHMALKYYGAATKDKWMQIYEANKEQLGAYPGLIRPGDKVVIPELKGDEQVD